LEWITWAAAPSTHSYNDLHGAAWYFHPDEECSWIILGTKEGGLRHTHLGEVGLYQRTTGDVKGLFLQQSHRMG